jgi:hypothetical protein
MFIIVAYFVIDSVRKLLDTRARVFVKKEKESRHGSVSIALGYELDDCGSRVRFPAWAGNFSLHHRVQNGFGAHPASYPMGTRGSILRGKAAET